MCFGLSSSVAAGGYFRLTIGAAVARTLPGRPTSERHVISGEQIAGPTVLVEA